MPALDPARRALLLTAEELRAAEALAERPEGLDGWPAELLEVVSRPAYRLVLERFVAEHMLVEQAWAAPGMAVWGMPVEGGVELTPIVTSLLPYQVMRSCGLGPSPHGPRPVLSARTAALDAASSALSDGDEDRAAWALGGDVEVLALLRERRSTWRASSVWTDPGGTERTSTVTVCDAGPLGLYRVSSEDLPEHPDDLRLTFTPIAPSEAWRAVCDLFPAPEPAFR